MTQQATNRTLLDNIIKPLPCPLCGSDKVIRNLIGKAGQVICKECNLRLDSHDGINDAVKKWNMRDNGNARNNT